MKFITHMIDWVRVQIAAIQAAHHEAARNLVLRLSIAFLTWFQSAPAIAGGRCGQGWPR